MIIYKETNVIYKETIKYRDIRKFLFQKQVEWLCKSITVRFALYDTSLSVFIALESSF